MRRFEVPYQFIQLQFISVHLNLFIESEQLISSLY